MKRIEDIFDEVTPEELDMILKDSDLPAFTDEKAKKRIRKKIMKKTKSSHGVSFRRIMILAACVTLIVSLGIACAIGGLFGRKTPNPIDNVPVTQGGEVTAPVLTPQTDHETTACQEPTTELIFWAEDFEEKYYAPPSNEDTAVPDSDAFTAETETWQPPAQTEPEESIGEWTDPILAGDIVYYHGLMVSSTLRDVFEDGANNDKVIAVLVTHKHYGNFVSEEEYDKRCEAFKLELIEIMELTEKLNALLGHGDVLALGGGAYTPDANGNMNLSKAEYDELTQYYGELLDEYIADGVFLRYKVEEKIEACKEAEEIWHEEYERFLGSAVVTAESLKEYFSFLGYTTSSTVKDGQIIIVMSPADGGFAKLDEEMTNKGGYAHDSFFFTLAYKKDMAENENSGALSNETVKENVGHGVDEYDITPKEDR